MDTAARNLALCALPWHQGSTLVPHASPPGLLLIRQTRRTAETVQTVESKPVDARAVLTLDGPPTHSLRSGEVLDPSDTLSACRLAQRPLCCAATRMRSGKTGFECLLAWVRAGIKMRQGSILLCTTTNRLRGSALPWSSSGGRAHMRFEDKDDGEFRIHAVAAERRRTMSQTLRSTTIAAGVNPFLVRRQAESSRTPSIRGARHV
jgi:hypothetical protein